jgi:hypothetical protein
MDETYTVGTWRVRAGNEDAFVREWRALGEFFLALPQAPGPGTLVQSVDDPTSFVSFGPWPSREAVQAMRAHPETPARIGRLMALCEEAQPGTYRVVAIVP